MPIEEAIIDHAQWAYIASRHEPSMADIMMSQSIAARYQAEPSSGSMSAVFISALECVPSTGSTRWATCLMDRRQTSFPRIGDCRTYKEDMGMTIMTPEKTTSPKPASDPKATANAPDPTPSGFTPIPVPIHFNCPKVRIGQRSSGVCWAFSSPSMLPRWQR